MLPCNPRRHAAYQNTFISNFLKFYPDPFVLSKNTRDYIVQFWYLNLSQTDSLMRVSFYSYRDLPILPLLERASRHGMLSFLHSFSL